MGLYLVSGWHSLKGLAVHQGSSLDLNYLRILVKDHGYWIIPKHFIPPVMVNAVLGAVLWTTYSEASVSLSPFLGTHPTLLAAAAGAASGAAQAVVAAPAENVRLIFEGGTGGHGWSHAWKEVFKGVRDSQPASPPTKRQAMQDVRQVRFWMKEVRDMAGRGWEGWGWGCAKDACGFAAFFAVFDVTRRMATEVESASRDFANKSDQSDIEDQPAPFTRHVPRTMRGLTLVSGGVIAGLAYEFSPWRALLHKVEEEGFLYLFRDPASVHYEHTSGTHHKYKRLSAMLRTLGRTDGIFVHVPSASLYWAALNRYQHQLHRI
ncbi:hypothetical protein ONZ45_g5483 [Pleurotus djamor]|nr:hypothetical protein ONZ45_g5483 [Pleurotus djamor]